MAARFCKSRTAARGRFGRALGPGLLLILALPALAGESASGVASNHEHLLGLSPFWQVVGIVAATLLSEDLTCIAVGTFIRAGLMDPVLATTACLLGIWIGDLGYWLLGRVLGRRVLQIGWVARRLPMDKVEYFGRWFDRRAYAVAAVCRFLPALRIYIYISIGAVSRRRLAFPFWTLVMAALWTPALIAATVGLGEVFTQAFGSFIRTGWIVTVIGVVLIYVVLKVAIHMATPHGRQKLARLVLRRRREQPQARDAVHSQI